MQPSAEEKHHLGLRSLDTPYSTSPSCSCHSGSSHSPGYFSSAAQCPMASPRKLHSCLK